MRIGYQGDIGSNAEKATKLFVKKLKIKNAQLIPLVTSKNVINAFYNNKIDYGVIAIKNNNIGIVEESQVVLQNKDITINGKLELPIHHCLFKKSKNSNIKKIATHIQAYKQCLNNINEYFPNIQFIEIEDTALAAQLLYNNKLDNDTGIICRKEIGIEKELILVKENFEDNKNNYTEFIFFKINIHK